MTSPPFLYSQNLFESISPEDADRKSAASQLDEFIKMKERGHSNGRNTRSIIIFKRISRLCNSCYLKSDQGNRLHLARELGSALSCSAVAVGSLVATSSNSPTNSITS